MEEHVGRFDIKLAQFHVVNSLVDSWHPGCEIERGLTFLLRGDDAFETQFSALDRYRQCQPRASQVFNNVCPDLVVRSLFHDLLPRLLPPRSRSLPIEMVRYRSHMYRTPMG